MAVVQKGKQLEVVGFLLTNHSTGFPEDTGDNTGHLGQQDLFIRGSIVCSLNVLAMVP